MNERKKIVLLVVLLFLGAFLRFYRLSELMSFLGDEGRDMLIVKDIIEFKNFPVVGPPTSVGKLFLGPIYYYFIAPFAYVFGMSPIGPAVFVALLGVATIYLIYLVGKNFFNVQTGLIAASLYTVSPLAVIFSRSSWNPNPMPFFTLLMMLSFFWWKKRDKAKFLYLAAFSFSVMLQLHYLSVLMIPFFIFLIWKLGGEKFLSKEYFLTGLIIILMMSPLFLFDLRHDFYNLRGLLEIISGRSKEGFSLIDLFSRSRDRVRQLYGLFFSFKERSLQNHLLALFSLLVFFWQWLKNKKQIKIIIFAWVFWGFLSLGFYRHSVYPHYLGFMYPLPAILTANLLDLFIKKRWLGKIIGFILLAVLLVVMIRGSWAYLARPKTINVKKIKKTVRLIEEESNKEPFNFALLAENNYDSSYRYFFELWEIPVYFEKRITDQLFVVCEDKKMCKPEGNPKWEIAMFDAAYNGKIKKAGFWQLDEVLKIYKFIPGE